MKTRIIPIFLTILLYSCASKAPNDSTEAFPPASSYTPAPSSTTTYTPSPTDSSTPNPAVGTPLPTQLTIIPTLNPTQTIQQEEIKSVIQEYFDFHYRVLSISPPEDFQETGFGDLVSDGADAKDFLVTEIAKLELERKYYESKELRYAKYNYSLNYHSIIVDDATGLADVSLYDIFEFITERASEANPEDPLVSSGGLSHEILLSSEGGQWKIVSDIYRDAFWRTLRQPESTVDDVLRNIEIMLADLEERETP